MDSILSIFKIGVGPSSSHTIGPIVAMNKFCELFGDKVNDVHRVQVVLHGSLSLTGKGHLTDIGCIIGLCGVAPKDVTPEGKREIIHNAISNNKLILSGINEIEFIYDRDIVFDDSMLPLHENGLIASAFDKDNNTIITQTYYSTGGGFVATPNEIGGKTNGFTKKEINSFEFESAQRLSELCNIHKHSIPEIVMLRESGHMSKKDIKAYCLEIYDAMMECYNNGITSKERTLPGIINLKRLAPAIKKRLDENQKEDLDPLAMIDYVSMYARAVAEENASGGKVVTAPTNGACGVIPAVLLYIQNHRFYMDEEKIINFILTAAAIGYLYKKNASISGAEAGCQAEIGVASSMAAAAMAIVSGASTEQVFNAAEIAMEHHLGLTCDPVGGLVQIPCIERNVLGAIKAISAAKMVLDGDATARVSLDEVIITMYKTGKDMNSKYKETSLGGLAKMVNC
ncbi:L-serine ammonia-lyase [Campylobacter pinnipediorum]|uniref:L-serine ammonia-lyase n=1 Tax=Campylobacter pinnipediorum TaxID=1965231 RepID=UPI00084D42FD|nr:L-serine ammonia-lyase [Campylobacter pinnipediorum]